MTDEERIKRALGKKRAPRKSRFPAADYLPTGITELNLACSDSVLRGLLKGRYYLIVGDSGSGKTWLAHTILAEAANHPTFKNYRLIYDNVEDGALMDIERYFGKRVAEAIEPPQKVEEGENLASTTIEDFYYSVDDAVKQAEQTGTPFIYVLDSESSLTSAAEIDKFEEQKKAARADKETAGSYGDGKAKIHSSSLRKLMTPLKRTGSFLFILSQTRDNIGFGFEKRTRSGGRALTFYAAIEMWMAKTGPIKKTVRGKPRQIGINAEVRVKKNRVTGKDRTVSFPIYHSFGIDDVGNCVDYLVREGLWKKVKNSIKATEIDFIGTREALIKHIEESNLEGQVSKLVGRVWKEIEEACEVPRKKKYQ